MGSSSENSKHDPMTMQMYPPPPPSPSPAWQQQYSYQQYPNPYAPPQFQHPNPYPINPNPYSNCSQPPPYGYDYYYQQQQQHQSLSKQISVIDESDRSASFGRVLLTLIMVLLSTILTITLIIWFLFGAYLPEFEVASIKLSNFSATNTSLSGAWTVAMFVKNVNMELHVDFHHAMSSVFYRDSLLGIVALDPFHVPKTQRFALNFTVPALRNPDDQRLHSWVLPTLAEDRSDGAVVVSLRLAMDANFTAPDVVYRQESIRIYCEDLVIRFSPSTGEGTWSPGLGNPCFIRMRDSHD